ncbi:MAG: M20/M25/M40 family metallo-hydrolase [Alkalispirochaeta sp.]
MTTAEKLAAGIRIPTVAQPDNPIEERARLEAWQSLMVDLFPRVHATLTVEASDPYRLVYRWDPSGGDTGSTRRPLLLMAHYDVVPADGEGWSVDPFAGVIRDEAVWGRGALDNKLSHIAILQAVEELIESGFTPTRPVYLAFGGDEEIGGGRGAHEIAETFRERGIRFAVTLDEGAIIADGIVPGVASPVALIGCGEKGHVNFRITVTSRGGHASNPPPHDAAVTFARVLSRLLGRRMRPRRTATVTAFIRAFGTVLGGINGGLLRGYPATAPLVHRVLAASPETDSMIRDTQVLTMLSGSDAPNVLPRTLRGNINVRLLPGSTVDGVLADMKRRIERSVLRGSLSGSVTIEPAPGVDNMEAPPESPASGPAYDTLSRVIATVWPGTPVLPYLVTATTDSRHYASVSDTVYRFLPYVLTREDIAGIHGVDEHVRLENIDRAVAFYRTWIETHDGADL